ncbi:MAG TPA: DUF6448 family protein [Actinomycetota bacterium]|jgi:hypothetical protein|nr:DUF6448 family protein [Actinomycetota bacterium]
MPPHCDAIDGPVVKAATLALDAEDVDLILPYVQVEGEDEVRTAFERAVAARRVPEGREIADLYFFETVVRVHRAGEGAPYTGLKSAGLDVGPVIPVAERAIETGSPDELLRLLGDTLHDELKHRFDEVMALQKGATGPVPEARVYVEAMLGLQVWSHKLYGAIRAPAHG